ncbi:response regulator [Mesorhizobium sp. RP14(2022)]|jgi:two-component SAPR family response regulator|uniref:Response regulator n=1 Tax=Mesorhizobium liriopis TaxID=2953882 RepID=A0ABT1C577_9HYPH|nr:response regulator [Mesorhizobium liriopis]MCO6049976.1 response regulator [Mesorhizobium liriopis]
MSASASDEGTKGLSVFVVEDEALVALNLEDMLAELGCTIIGPVMRLDRAEQMLADGIDADVAILDVNVAGQMVFPFARRLAENGVPIVFATGYGRAGLPEDLHDMPILQKPYTMDDVALGLRSAVSNKSA